MFLGHVYRLHRMLKSIVSDRDPLFLRQDFGTICLRCLVASSTCLPSIISKAMARPNGPVELCRMYCNSWSLLLTTVFTPVQVKYHLMLTDCTILGCQSRLCAARASVEEGPSLRSEQMRRSVMVSPMLCQKLALVTLPVPQWSRHTLSVLQSNDNSS